MMLRLPLKTRYLSAFVLFVALACGSLALQAQSVNANQHPAAFIEAVTAQTT